MIFRSRHSLKTSEGRRQSRQQSGYRGGRQGGFFAVSVLIIVAVLEGAALATSLTLSLVTQTVTDSQRGVQTIFDSESCDQIELLRLATDPYYAGNETVVLPDGTCVTKKS